jgi:hypothetical protein
MHELDAEDISTIADILRKEYTSHCRWRSRFLALFMLFLTILLIALVLLILHALGNLTDVATRLNADLWLLPAIGSLAGGVMSFLSMWWAQQNCLHSIERTLFAAQRNRSQLFAKFLEQIQCADQKKKKFWAEVLKGAVS